MTSLKILINIVKNADVSKWPTTGLFTLHYYCDVKSNNVLVSGKKGFLIDFGKACPISRPTARKYSSFYNHIATEVLRGFPVSTSTDVFSLGVIIHSVGKKLTSACLEFLGKHCKHSKSVMRPSVPEVLRVLRENLQ